MQFKIHNIDWDFILSTIKKEKCVLLLGPEIFRTNDGKPFKDALIEYLNDEQNKHISDYYAHDELYLFKSGMSKTLTAYKIEEFYRNNLNKDNYLKLAEIPFHLIISINPDVSLKEIYDENGIACNFDYYSHSKNPVEIQQPTLQTPLLYNLFGNINRDESLILTHSDLYNFLFSILGVYKLPKGLLNSLNSARNFIFLGFSFEKWYVQILLRLFNLHDENSHFYRFASNNNLNNETKQMCNRQFNIEFIDSGIDEFIGTLHQKCSEDKHMTMRRLDRKEQTQNKSQDEIIKDYIKNGNIAEALNLLTFIFKGKREENEVILLYSRYNTLQTLINKKVINLDYANIEMNQIKDATLNLASLIADMVPAS